MGRALVLNASDSPLAVVPARRAVVLVLKEKAEVIVSNGMVFRSATISMEAPSVVRLRRYVRVPYRPHAPLTRRAVFARDEWTCQYCAAPAENLDHVIPRSRGGTHTWENVVAACRRCNAKKENRTPQEAGFHLARRPFAPTDGFRLTLGRLEPGWEDYLTVHCASPSTDAIGQSSTDASVSHPQPPPTVLRPIFRNRPTFPLSAVDPVE